MKLKINLFALVVSAMLLSACADNVQEDDSGKSDSGAKTSSAGALNTINGVAFDKADSPDSVRTIYFEYDKSDVLPEFLPIIAAHGRYLASNGSLKAELQGHADERGSREYNVALGERRALSVRRLLIANGANASQMETISYGEERPAVVGHDENAWSKNRRVEIHYR